MTEVTYTFAFFPYLKTYEPVNYRNLIIRSSDDETGLPSEAIQHFETLRIMFFLRDHVRIARTSYVFHALTDKLTASQFTRQLLEFQTLVCFIYSSPHPTSGEPFLQNEHSSLYLFQPKQFPKGLIVEEHNTEILPEAQAIKADSRSFVDGYEVRLNDKSYFWVTQGSRIYPPATHLWLNISQNLSTDFPRTLYESQLYEPLVHYFASREENDDIGERILTALTWYNRSIGIDIDESVALINLAIAFESLLNLDQGEQLTARFKDAVTLLAGDVPRLDSWLTQFYKARSEIVHKGRSASLMFVATDNPQKPPERLTSEYRSLTSYGRQIFQVCVATVITGSQIAKRLNLASLLVTNQQRLERISQALNKTDGTSIERIQASYQDVDDIENYRFVPENGLKYEQLIGTARLLVEQYLASTPNESPELIAQMKEFAAVNSSNQFAALSLIKELQERMIPLPSPSTPNNTHNIVASLTNSVWHYSFMYYFHLKDSQKITGS